MPRRLAFAALAAALTLSGAAGGAELKKWVDAEGRVHYSDQPPPSGVKQEEVNIRNVPAPPEAAPPKTYQDKELEFRKRRIEAEEQRKKDEQATADARAERQNCIEAQNRLRSIEDTGRVFTYDAKGERQYLDDAGRDREIEKARQAIQTWCK